MCLLYTTNYLWHDQVQGSDKAEFFRLVDDNIFYEDFNYKVPFIGKVQIYIHTHQNIMLVTET